MRVCISWGLHEWDISWICMLFPLENTRLSQRGSREIQRKLSLQCWLERRAVTGNTLPYETKASSASNGQRTGRALKGICWAGEGKWSRRGCDMQLNFNPYVHYQFTFNYMMLVDIH